MHDDTEHEPVITKETLPSGRSSVTKHIVHDLFLAPALEMAPETLDLVNNIREQTDEVAARAQHAVDEEHRIGFELEDRNKKT
jgi:hypothetical protein